VLSNFQDGKLQVEGDYLPGVALGERISLAVFDVFYLSAFLYYNFQGLEG
jgi:hypothetical protein